MELIPAIDLRDGRCVRLVQGDFDRTTVYGDDPVAMALRWQSEGATRLHLVDLDGARLGRPTQTDTIRAICQAVSIPVQMGGGLRDEAAVQTALDLGLEHVILGTLAVNDLALTRRLVERYGAAISIGIDARDGIVATEGWLGDGGVAASSLASQMAEIGIQRIIYTDISRDGTLSEPNFEATASLVRADGPAIIASGGIAETQHLVRLAQLGVSGAIIGIALYTGRINLAAALDELAALTNAKES